MSIVSFRGPQDIKTPADVKRYLAELDRERPLEESHYDRRLRERAEEQAEKTQTNEAEAARRQSAQEWSAWGAQVNDRIGALASRLDYIETMILPDDSSADGQEKGWLLTAVARVLSKATKGLRDEIAALKREVEGMKERAAKTTGELPQVQVWRAESVAYKGQLFFSAGALWQAKCDTAKRPGDSADWTLIAARGEDGRDGRDGSEISMRGSYDMSDCYARNDVCQYGEELFIALKDNPGVCPGADWQRLAPRGLRGAKGERGRKGERGERGDPALTIASWQIDREKFVAVPFMTDGTAGPALHLRKFFEAYRDMTSE